MRVVAFLIDGMSGRLFPPVGPAPCRRIVAKAEADGVVPTAAPRLLVLSPYGHYDAFTFMRCFIQLWNPTFCIVVWFGILNLHISLYFSVYLSVSSHDRFSPTVECQKGK